MRITGNNIFRRLSCSRRRRLCLRSLLRVFCRPTKFDSDGPCVLYCSSRLYTKRITRETNNLSRRIMRLSYENGRCLCAFDQVPFLFSKTVTLRFQHSGICSNGTLLQIIGPDGFNTPASVDTIIAAPPWLAHF